MRVVVLVLAILCALPLCASPTPRRAEEPESWMGQNVALPQVAALKHATLAKEAREVKNWVFTRGSATYTLSGQAAYLMAGDTICGVYFKGQGRFKYTTHDQMEFPVTRFNASRHLRAKLECSPGAISVGDVLDEATFWFAGGTPLELPGGPGTLAASDFEAQQKFFRTPDGNAFFHGLALRLLDPARKPYFCAELRGRDQPWVHEVDEAKEETLLALAPYLNDDGTRFDVTILSRCPIGWDLRAPRNVMGETRGHFHRITA